MSLSDQEKHLLEKLKSGKRPEKLQAIIKLHNFGKSEQILQSLLSAIQTHRDDKELIFYSVRAIEQIVQRERYPMPDLGKYLNQPSKSGKEHYPDSKTLIKPSPEDIQKIFSIIRSYDYEPPKEIIPALGSFLSKHATAEDAPYLKSYMLRDEMNATLPLLTAARLRLPQLLPEILPFLLTSKNPTIRCRAITVLKAINPEDAKKHFLSMVASHRIEDKIAALEIAFMFPFEFVCDYTIKLVATETDHELLSRANILIASNPSIETALKILDHAETVNGAKKKLLKQMFTTVCKALTITHKGDPQEITPAAIIKRWQEQKLDKFLANIEVRLVFNDLEENKRIVAWLLKNQKDPKIRPFIDSLADNPQTESIYRQEILPNLQPLEKSQDADESSDTSEDSETLIFLKQVDLPALLQNKKMILDLANNASGSLKAEAINALSRNEPLLDYANLAVDALNEENSEVRIAGFNLLQKVNKDKLRLRIPKLLNDEEPMLRFRAVSFALTYDKTNARASLFSLLKSPEPRVRSNAISAIMLFPFESVKTALINQLKQEDNQYLAEKICFIFSSNPSATLLNDLYKLQGTLRGDIEIYLAEAINKISELLPYLPPELQKEPKKEAADISQYSPENIRKLSSKKAQPHVDRKELYKNESLKFILALAALIFFIAVLPSLFMGRTSTKTPTYKAPKSSKTPTRTSERKRKFAKAAVPNKFTMNRACEVTGEIKALKSEFSLILKTSDILMEISFQEGMPKDLSVGDVIKVKCVPYRQNSRDIIMAKGMEIN